MERFDDDAVRRILARARGLDTSDDVDNPPGVEAAALVAAAEEVGLDPNAVRASIALERLGDAPTRSSLLDRVSGPGTVIAQTRVDRSSDDALDLAETWLSQAHRMSCRRVAPTELVARRRSDMVASVGRSLTEWRGDGRVGRLASVTVEAEPIPMMSVQRPDIGGDMSSEDGGDVANRNSAATGSVIRITADRTPTRRRRLTAGGVFGGTGVAIAAVGIAESLFAWPIPAAVLTGLGGAAALSGRRHAERVEGDLDVLIASITAGDEPVGTLRRVAQAARRRVGG